MSSTIVFVSTSLSKFPGIFNIEEEKKGFFHISLPDQNSGTMWDLFLTWIITTPNRSHQLREWSSLNGTINK